MKRGVIVNYVSILSDSRTVEAVGDIIIIQVEKKKKAFLRRLKKFSREGSRLISGSKKIDTSSTSV